MYTVYLHVNWLAVVFLNVFVASLLFSVPPPVHQCYYETTGRNTYRVTVVLMHMRENKQKRDPLIKTLLCGATKKEKVL